MEPRIDLGAREQDQALAGVRWFQTDPGSELRPAADRFPGGDRGKLTRLDDDQALVRHIDHGVRTTEGCLVAKLKVIAGRLEALLCERCDAQAARRHRIPELRVREHAASLGSRRDARMTEPHGTSPSSAPPRRTLLATVAHPGRTTTGRMHPPRGRVPPWRRPPAPRPPPPRRRRGPGRRAPSRPPAAC